MTENPSLTSGDSVSDESSGTAARWGPTARLILVALQVGLAVLVIEQFQIESRAFFRISILAFFGFLVNALLPMRFRLAFFLLLSVTGIFVVLGVQSGAWLVGLGIVLIAICHLPLAFPIRTALLLAAGAGLATLRSDAVETPWSSAIWPILGSMFMFRLIIYMYDLRHEKAPRSIFRTFSYFFMLPNVCFALFPIVDYTTFRRTYYNDDPAKIYEVGARWIARGIVHLVLYRFVYFYCTLAPVEVASPVDLAQFLVANFALYLRVSGVFHIAIGILRLFGFNLPETNHLYFLSSSVNDFWRRINIYWRDFMLKVFYYPAFVRLRKRGTSQAVVLSTLSVVLVTWLLHSYQWFWLRGTFPVRWQDAVFWSALGGLMIANSVYEMKHPKARGLRARAWSLRDALPRGLQIAGTFTLLCCLWSLWTCETLDQWLSLWDFASEPGARAGDRPLASAAVLPPLLLVIALAQRGGGQGRGGRLGKRAEGSPARTALLTALPLLLLYALGTEPVQARLGAPTADLVQSLRVPRLNRADAAKLHKGYYEELFAVDRFSPELWKLYEAKPQDWLPLWEIGASRETGDFLRWELIPSAEFTFHRARFTTNRWGLRDREYEKAKPPGTARVVLLGASYSMGEGVADGETFEAVLENRLNREGKGERAQRYEILNFSVSGYSPLQRMQALETKALAFEPDAVFYVAHPNDMGSAINRLMENLTTGIRPPHPFLQRLLREAGVDARTPPSAMRKRLRSHGPELLRWTYNRIAATARDSGAVPVWIYLPTLTRTGMDRSSADYVALATNAGFAVLDLSDVYDEHNIFSMRVADWDHHPNARGHELIAERLYARLLADEISLGEPSGGRRAELGR